MHPRNKTLEDRLDAEFAEAWKPDPGDRLIGIIDELGRFDAGHGAYPTVTVIAETGSTETGKPIEVGERRTFHSFHEVAQRELSKIAPRLGDRVGIRFDGKHPEKGYGQYRITSDSEPAFNWKEFGHQGADEEPDAEDNVVDPTTSPDDDADSPPF